MHMSHGNYEGKRLQPRDGFANHVILIVCFVP